MHILFVVDLSLAQLSFQLFSGETHHFDFIRVVRGSQFFQEYLPHYYLLLLLKDHLSLLVQLFYIVLLLCLLRPLVQKIPLEYLFEVAVLLLPFSYFRLVFIVQKTPPHQLFRVHAFDFLLDSFENDPLHGCFQLEHPLLVLYPLQLLFPFDLLLPLIVLFLKLLILCLFQALLL